MTRSWIFHARVNLEAFFYKLSDVTVGVKAGQELNEINKLWMIM